MYSRMYSKVRWGGIISFEYSCLQDVRTGLSEKVIDRRLSKFSLQATGGASSDAYPAFPPLRIKPSAPADTTPHTLPVRPSGLAGGSQSAGPAGPRSARAAREDQLRYEPFPPMPLEVFDLPTASSGTAQRQGWPGIAGLISVPRQTLLSRGQSKNGKLPLDDLSPTPALTAIPPFTARPAGLRPAGMLSVRPDPDLYTPAAEMPELQHWARRSQLQQQSAITPTPGAGLPRWDRRS